jgi:hypothetical protein
MPLLLDAGRAFHGRDRSTLDWIGPAWLLTSFIELTFGRRAQRNW